MSKYKNKSLYLYKGIPFYRTEDCGDTYYRSATGHILNEDQIKNSEFFDSFLESETYKYLKFWVDAFKKNNSTLSAALIRQFPVVLIPESKCFPAYKHRVDFAISIKWDGDTHNTVYLIEAKGIITKDSMLVLRLLELQYQGISEDRYIMVFQKYPEKFPRQFPKELIKSTLLGLISTLNKYIKPIDK